MCIPGLKIRHWSHADLCSLIVCQSADDLKAQARWDGALGSSRHILLEELSSVLLISCHYSND